MIIGYGCADYKGIVSHIHKKHPEVTIMFLGAIGNDNVRSVLNSGQIDIYLLTDPASEPFLTHELYSEFTGSVIYVPYYCSDPADVSTIDMDRFDLILQSRINNIQAALDYRRVDNEFK